MSACVKIIQGKGLLVTFLPPTRAAAVEVLSTQEVQVRALPHKERRGMMHEHQVDLEETTSSTSLARLLAEAGVLDRILAEKEFGSPYWVWFGYGGSCSSELSLELQPGCARWKTFQLLRLVSKGVKAVVEAQPEFHSMNKLRQLRQALHERHQEDCSQTLRRPHGADLRELPPEILEKIIENHREAFGNPMRRRSCPFGWKGDRYGATRWDAYQRLRLVCRGMKRLVEALPDWKNMFLDRALRLAMERESSGMISYTERRLEGTRSAVAKLHNRNGHQWCELLSAERKALSSGAHQVGQEREIICEVTRDDAIRFEGGWLLHTDRWPWSVQKLRKMIESSA